jgi:chromosome segregation ATPase
MFPTLEVPQEQQPPDSDAVVAKLLQVQLTEAEQDVLELQIRVRQLEFQLEGSSGTPGDGSAQSKEAELTARVSVLENTLKNLRLAVSTKDSQIQQMSEVFQQLEEQTVQEREEYEEKLHVTQELVHTAAFEGEQLMKESVQDAIAQTMAAEATKWMRKMGFILKIDDASRNWSDVKNIANAELDYVHQMQATLHVLATGLATIKVD